MNKINPKGLAAAMLRKRGVKPEDIGAGSATAQPSATARKPSALRTRMLAKRGVVEEVEDADGTDFDGDFETLTD